MRTILIPTDFTIQSLIAVKKVLAVNDGDRVKVVLFHCVNVSESFKELILFSKEKLLKKLMSETFADACSIIKNKYEKHLVQLKVEIFAGNTQQAFSSFVEAEDADIICYIDEYDFQKPSKNSISPATYLANTSIPVLKINVEQREILSSLNQLAILFSK